MGAWVLPGLVGAPRARSPGGRSGCCWRRCAAGRYCGPGYSSRHGRPHGCRCRPGVARPRGRAGGWAGLLAVALGAVDLVHHRLPDALTLPAIPITAAVIAGVESAPGTGSPGTAVIVAIVGTGLFWALSALAPRAMGLGDVKLLPSLALLTGYLSVAAALLAVVIAFRARRAGGAERPCGASTIHDVGDPVRPVPARRVLAGPYGPGPGDGRGRLNNPGPDARVGLEARRGRRQRYHQACHGRTSAVGVRTPIAPRPAGPRPANPPSIAAARSSPRS